MRVHPDTYLPRLSAFTTYDGVTMPQSHEWDDAATPRTDAPVRFAVVRWPSRDGACMDRLTCIRPQWSRPVNRPFVRFPA